MDKHNNIARTSSNGFHVGVCCSGFGPKRAWGVDCGSESSYRIGPNFPNRSKSSSEETLKLTNHCVNEHVMNISQGILGHSNNRAPVLILGPKTRDSKVCFH